MARWYRLSITQDQIIAQTFKAGLIKLDAQASTYNNYCFWFPKKLIRQNGSIKRPYTFSLTLEFKIKIFKLLKNGTKKDEKEISALELLTAHGISAEDTETEKKEKQEKKETQTQTELNFEAKKNGLKN